MPVTAIANDIGILGVGDCADIVTLAGGPLPTKIISQPNPTGGSIVNGESRPEDIGILLLKDCADSLKQGTTYVWFQIIVSYLDIFGHKQIIAESVCYNRQDRQFRPCVRGQMRD
jgi:hypothetical protein